MVGYVLDTLFLIIDRGIENKSKWLWRNVVKIEEEKQTSRIEGG